MNRYMSGRIRTSRGGYFRNSPCNYLFYDVLGES